MPITIPNMLTWGRILLIPLFIGVFYLPYSWLSLEKQNLFSTIVFVIAALTDWLDGYLARSLKQTSAFGEFLDPVADKLMVTAALIMLVQLTRIDALIALTIIGREIAIAALREWMARVGAARSVAVSILGKIKTACQLTAIPLLLYHDPVWGCLPQQVGTWLIYLAVVLTLWSMIVYLRMAWTELTIH